MSAEQNVRSVVELPQSGHLAFEFDESVYALDYRMGTGWFVSLGALQIARVRGALARAGYPAVELTVSDRRLVIANTSLAELRDGLSQVLAERLAEISAGVRSRHDAAAVRVQHATETEHDRLAAVTAFTESVRFDSGSPGSDRDHHADGGDPPGDGHAH